MALTCAIRHFRPLCLPQGLNFRLFCCYSVEPTCWRTAWRVACWPWCRTGWEKSCWLQQPALHRAPWTARSRPCCPGNSAKLPSCCAAPVDWTGKPLCLKLSEVSGSGSGYCFKNGGELKGALKYREGGSIPFADPKSFFFQPLWDCQLCGQPTGPPYQG